MHCLVVTEIDHEIKNYREKTLLREKDNFHSLHVIDIKSCRHIGQCHIGYKLIIFFIFAIRLLVLTENRNIGTTFYLRQDKT